MTASPGGRAPGPDHLALAIEAAGDTGGGWYRPVHRRQDPAADPAEPWPGESAQVGHDHAWGNCTMAAGAMALDYQTEGRVQVWGGHLRHHQADQTGGTDLRDLRKAWQAYGEVLSVRTGLGWAGLVADRAQGRFLVVQGRGILPGVATFTGGHAAALGPETNDQGYWLWGDPLASGWQWVSPTAVRRWMEAWSKALAYARTAAHPPATAAVPRPIIVPPPLAVPPPADTPGPPPPTAAADLTWGTWTTATWAVPAAWPPPPVEEPAWDSARWPGPPPSWAAPAVPRPVWDVTPWETAWGR